MQAEFSSPFLTPVELVKRWRDQISESTLANWRSAGQGPAFAKIGGRILYAMSDVEAWEAARKIGKLIIVALLAFTLALADDCDAADIGDERTGIPVWVMQGIAAVESSSHWVNGALVYVDRRDGLAGEAGPFQMTPGAFYTIGGKPEDFSRLRTDMDFAERMAARYLHWLRARTDSWETAVRAYNVGLRRSALRGASYLRRVKQAAPILREAYHAVANP